MDRAEIHGIELEVAHIPGPTERAPLVFLHEGLGSVSMWTQRDRDWPRELCAASGRAGWLYSRRGYGNSDPVADVRGKSQSGSFWHIGRHEPDYMHLEAWRVLPELLQRLGLDQSVLIGHSDGASIALLHASRYPVAASVVMAPHVFVEDIAIQAIDSARRLYETDQGERGLRQRLARYHSNVNNAFYQWNDVWLSPAFRRFDIRADCSNIRAPVLAIQGLNDEYGSLQQLREIEARVTGAQTLELPECGHSPHRDKPELLTSAIVGFLSNVR